MADFNPKVILVLAVIFQVLKFNLLEKFHAYVGMEALKNALQAQVLLVKKLKKAL